MALAALRVNDKDARSMSRAAVFEAKLGLKAEASAHAAQAVALAPRDPDVQYKQAVVASLIGDRATALRALDQALTLGYKADDAGTTTTSRRSRTRRSLPRYSTTIAKEFR